MNYPRGLCSWHLRGMPRSLQAIQGLQYSQESNSWRLSGGCGNLDGLPTIYLMLGDIAVPLTPRQYTTQVRPRLQPATSWPGMSLCMSPFQGAAESCAACMCHEIVQKA